MLKSTLIAGIAVLGLASAAWAGEGNGDPFPGPDAAVSTLVQQPTYTMGANAPFNYFATAKPTAMNGYTPAPNAADDPYPFRMSGQMIRVTPTPPNAVANHSVTSAGNG